MFSRSLAILLAVLGLYLCAIDAAAQPRGWGGGAGRGGFAAPGRFAPAGGSYGRGGFGGGRFGAGRFGAGRFGGAPFGNAPFEGSRGPGAGFVPGRGGFGPYPGEGYGASDRMGGAPRAFRNPAAGAAPFGGDWRGEQDEVRRAVREGRHIPLGQAIQAVRRRAPGRELDAGLEPGPNGRPVYRLRWAGQDGRRQDYMVDAGTGAVLGVQGGP